MGEIAPNSISAPKSIQPQLNRIAFDRIKQDIIRCALEPGKQVTEAQLAARYGMGKAPIRAALLGLCQAGFLRAIPRRGYLITPVTVRDVQDITQVRLLLEPTAARLAAGRMGAEQLARLNELCQVRHTKRERSGESAAAAHRELHLLIAKASGNRKLTELLGEIYDQVERLIHLCLSRVRPQEMLVYCPLVEAIANSDGDAAARLMVEQIELGRKRIIAVLLSASDENGIDITEDSNKREASLGDFANQVSNILATSQPGDIPIDIAKRLSRLLRSTVLLNPEQRESSSQSYRRHLLFEDPNGRFTVQARVWQAGQATPICGTPFWSVIGVYEGELRESSFQKFHKPDGTEQIVPNGVTHHRAGEVTYMDISGQALHSFDNPTKEVTISIHVFGTDRRTSEAVEDCYGPENWKASAPAS